MIKTERKAMHGPLWTAENAKYSIHLWGPSFTRDRWAVAWSNRDDEYDSGFEKRNSYEDALAIVPSKLAELVEAIRTQVASYDPDETCDHKKAHSWSIRPEGRVCGYCGRLVEDKR